MRKLAILLLILLLCGGTACSRIPPLVHAQEAEASSSGPYYKYIIIVPDDESWIGALQPFVEWKTREGLQYSGGYPVNCQPVKVANLTEVSSAYGSANASSIRQYIIDFWKSNNWTTVENTLKYVLLAGDVKYVPTYLYNVTISGENYSYATDQYYADFYYPATRQYINPAVDETDWNPEVYVGRFPVNTVQELRNVVNKTVTYEKHATALQQAPAGWQRGMLFLGAILDNGEGFNPVWKDGAYVAESIKRNCENWWFGTTGPIPRSATLYNTNNNPAIWSSGYGNLNNIHNLTTANIIGQMNNVGFSAVLSVSHGNTQSLQGRTSGSPGDWDEAFFENADVSLLRNGFALPFWFVDACHAGAFQTDLARPGTKCLGEELLLADPSSCGGVVGFIGCSSASWYTYCNGAPQNRPAVLDTLSDRLASLTFSKLYHTSSPTAYAPAKWGLGAALFEAKRTYKETSWDGTVPTSMHMATCLGFNLLGDPSLQIWSEKPSDASTFYNVSVPSTVSAGATFSVNVNLTSYISGGSYPSRGSREGAKICLSRSEGDGTVWSALNLTDSSGTATFKAPLTPGTYNLTVVDHPYLIPYMSQIQVLPLVHDIAVTDVSVSTTSVGQGLTLQINATVENQGGCAETFNVTAYANLTLIQTQEATLVSQESVLLTFLWDTAGQVLGNYIIRVEADQVPNETDASDNACTANYIVSVVPEFPQGTLIPLLIVSLTTAFLITKRRTSNSIRGIAHHEYDLQQDH